MNTNKFLRSIIAISATLICVAGFGVFKTFAADTHGYNTEKLLACYNSEDQVAGSTTWKDCTGNYNITIPANDPKIQITNEGLLLDGGTLSLPAEIVNAIKSKEFTIEMLVKNYCEKSQPPYNNYSFVESKSNANLRIYKNGDDFYVKSGSNDRPKFPGANSFLCKDCLITLAFRYNVTGYSDLCCLYINGEEVSSSTFSDNTPGTDGHIKGQIQDNSVVIGNSFASFTISSLRIYSRSIAKSQANSNYIIDVSRRNSVSINNTPVKMYIENDVTETRILNLDLSNNTICNEKFKIVLNGPLPNKLVGLAITNVQPYNSDFSNYGNRYIGKMSHVYQFQGEGKNFVTVDFKALASATTFKLNEGVAYIILFDSSGGKLLSFAQITVTNAATHKFVQLSLSTSTAGLNQNFVPIDVANKKFTNDVTITIKGTVNKNAYLIVTDLAPGQADFKKMTNLDEFGFVDHQIFWYNGQLSTSGGSQTINFSELTKTNAYPGNGVLGITPGKTYYLILSGNDYMSACIPFVAVNKATSYQKIGIKLDGANADNESIVRKTINAVKDNATVSVTGNTSMLNGADVYFVVTEMNPYDVCYQNNCAFRTFLGMNFVASSKGITNYSDIKINSFKSSYAETMQGSTLYCKNYVAGKKYYISLILDSPHFLRTAAFVLDTVEILVVDTTMRSVTPKLNTVQVICGNDLAVRVTGGSLLHYFDEEGWKTKTNPIYSEFNQADVVDYTVRFTINEKVNEVNVGENNMFVLTGLKFTDMLSNVKIELCKAGVVMDTVSTWSVKDYLEKDGSQSAKELLNLGSALLKYRGEEGFTVSGTLPVVSPDKPAVTLNPTKTGSSDYFYAGNLFLDDNVNLVFKFKITNGTKLVIKGDGNTVTITGDDLKKGRAESTDVFATGYGNKYTATLYDASGNVLSTVDYSVLTYIYDKYNEVDDSLKAVLDALYGLYRATL